MSATPQQPGAIGRDRYIGLSNWENAITAKAGGGQSGATPLTAQLNRVDTVASGNDSVALPKITTAIDTPGGLGFMIVVQNRHGSNSLQVFGASPDTINGIATGTGIAVAAGKCAIFWPSSYTQSSNVGDWLAISGA